MRSSLMASQIIIRLKCIRSSPFMSGIRKPGWVFGKSKQAEFSDLASHFTPRIAAEDSVSEVEQPESAAFAVVDVECAGAVFIRRHDEQQHALSVFDPMSDDAFRTSDKARDDFS